MRMIFRPSVTPLGLVARGLGKKGAALILPILAGIAL